MSQAVKHISISRAHILLQLFSPAFSRRSFSKTERHGSSGGMMKRGSFGSGRVNAVLYPSGPKPHSFSVRPDYRAVYCALRITSWTPQTGCVITRWAVKEKRVMQNTRDNIIYFLRVKSGATYYEWGIERQNKCNHLSYT